MNEDEQKAERAIAREIGKSIWRQKFNEANPSATPEDRKASWQRSRSDHVRLGMKILRSLEKSGYRVEKAA